MFHKHIDSPPYGFIPLRNVELPLWDARFFGSENKMLNMLDTDSALLEWGRQTLSKQLQSSLRSIMRGKCSVLWEHAVFILPSRLHPLPVGRESEIKLLNLSKAQFLLCKIVANNNTCFIDLLRGLIFFKSTQCSV